VAFSVHRPPSRDRSKSLTLVTKASWVKGLTVPRTCLWVWPPLLPIIPLPHPHATNSPPPRKALASESVPKGDRSAMCYLSSARSPRSSSPNRVVSHSQLSSPLSSPPYCPWTVPLHPLFFEHNVPFCNSHAWYFPPSYLYLPVVAL